MNDDSAHHRVQVRYTGRVQGVGFRYRVVELAQGRAINGFVMNYPDGSVVLVAEGPEAKVQEFLQDILDSPLAGFIQGTNALWMPSRKEFDGFGIRDFYR